MKTDVSHILHLFKSLCLNIFDHKIFLKVKDFARFLNIEIKAKAKIPTNKSKIPSTVA